MTPMLELDKPELLRQQAWVGGRWIDADGGAVLPVHNPAHGTLLGRVPALGAVETRRAIAAAHDAWPAWRDRLAGERAALLRRWHDLMLEHREDLARILTSEQGKPLAEARGEIAYAAGFLAWYAEEAKRIHGEVIASPWEGRRILTLRQPVGVCAAVTPWNSPAPCSRARSARRSRQAARWRPSRPRPPPSPL